MLSSQNNPRDNPFALLCADVIAKIGKELEGEIDLLKLFYIPGVKSALQSYEFRRPRLSIFNMNKQKYDLAVRMSRITKIIFSISASTMYDFTKIEGDIDTIHLSQVNLSKFAKYNLPKFSKLAEKLQNSSVSLYDCNLTTSHLLVLAKHNKQELRLTQCLVYNDVAEDKFTSEITKLTLDSVHTTDKKRINLNNFTKLTELNLVEAAEPILHCTEPMPTLTRLWLEYHDQCQCDSFIQQDFMPNIEVLVCSGSVPMLNKRLVHLTKLNSLKYRCHTYSRSNHRVDLEFGLSGLAHLADTLTTLHLELSYIFDVQQFNKLPNLQELSIEYGDYQQIPIPDFRVTNPLLDTLQLSGRLMIDCTYLTGEHIKRLYLSPNNRQLRNFDKMNKCVLLEYLNIKRADVDLDHIRGLGNLKEIHIAESTIHLSKLLYTLPALKKLNIVDCELQNIEDEAFCSETLEELSLLYGNTAKKIFRKDCDDIVTRQVYVGKLPTNYLGDMPNLRRLEICAGNDDLDINLKKYPKLTELKLQGFNCLKSIVNITSCKSLSKVTLMHCYEISDISCFIGSSVKEIRIIASEFADIVNESKLIAEFKKAGIKLGLKDGAL